MTEEIITTATIRVKPEVDLEIQAFYAEALKLADYATKRTIASIEDIKDATNDLSIISKLKKAMEEKRKTYLKPIQDHVKDVNEAFRTLMQPIENADLTTRNKIMAYNHEQEWKRQEQERINQLRAEAADAEAKLKGEDKPVELVAIIPEPPKRVQADIGALGTIKIRKFEVVDITKVPAEFLIVDIVKVGKLVRAGISSIPGIRIWEEDSLRVTTK